MDEQKKSIFPDFSTLTCIMERFHSVPFETFQQELKDWFEEGLKQQGTNTQKLQDSGLKNLAQFISSIYHQAEVLQTIHESGIDPSCHGKKE